MEGHKPIGLKKQIEYLSDWIKNGAKMGCIIYGPPGTGKTFTVKYVLKNLDCNIIDDIEVDEYDRIKFVSRTKYPKKTIIVFDNIFKIDSKKHIQLLKKTKNKFIYITNDISIFHHKLRELCAEIRFNRPDGRTLLKIAREYGINIKDFSGINGDVRQLLLKQYGSQGYDPEKTLNQYFMKYFTEGKFELEINEFMLAALLDNADLFYGYDMIKFIAKVITADYTGRPEPLKGMPKVKPTSINMYFINKYKLSGGGGH